jgi:hypothetical protein
MVAMVLETPALKNLEEFAKKWTEARESPSEIRACELGYACIALREYERPGVEVMSVALKDDASRYLNVKVARRVVCLLGRLRQDMHPHLPRLVAAFHVRTHIGMYMDLGPCASDLSPHELPFDHLDELSAQEIHTVAIQACEAVLHCHQSVGFMLRDFYPKDLAVHRRRDGRPHVVLKGFYRARDIRPNWRVYTRLQRSHAYRAPEMDVPISSPSNLACYSSSVDVYTLGQIFSPYFATIGERMCAVRESSRPSLREVIDLLEAWIPAPLGERRADHTWPLPTEPHLPISNDDNDSPVHAHDDPRKSTHRDSEKTPSCPTEKLERSPSFSLPESPQSMEV